MSNQAKIAFAQWVQKNDPFLFQVAVKRAEMLKGQGVGFLGIDWSSIATSVVDTVKSVAPSLVQYKAQSALLKTQLKRAENGLPPLQTAEYAPTVKIAAEITPETEAAATRIAAQSISQGMGNFGKILPFAAIGLVGFMLLRKRR